MRFVEVLGVVNKRRRRPNVHAHRQTEQVIDGRHPTRVAARQVVVHGDQMHALAGQRVEVQREAGDESFAFAGFHLGDLSLVQDDATDELDVEVAQTHGAATRLTAEGERLDQKLIEVLTIASLLAQLIGASAQARVVELFELGFERRDRLGDRKVTLDLALVGVEKPCQDRHGV